MEFFIPMIMIFVLIIFRLIIYSNEDLSKKIEEKKDKNQEIALDLEKRITYLEEIIKYRGEKKE